MAFINHILTKGIRFGAVGRVMILDPVGKAKSVVLTEEGVKDLGVRLHILTDTSYGETSDKSGNSDIFTSGAGSTRLRS
jgi:hypothetical protein